MRCRDRPKELFAEIGGQFIDGGKKCSVLGSGFSESVDGESRDPATTDHEIRDQAKANVLGLAEPGSNHEPTGELKLRAKQKTRVISAKDSALG